MTKLSGTINAGRMGRPPLKNIETKIRISPETKARIESLVGRNYQMAKFIREAIENELAKREAESGSDK